jgi:cellulase
MGRDMVCNVGGTKGVAGVCEVTGESNFAQNHHIKTALNDMLR